MRCQSLQRGLSLTLAITAPALAAPEFIVHPLNPPIGFVGQHPTASIGAAVVLVPTVKGNFAAVLDNQSGDVTLDESSPDGGSVQGVAGIEWRVCRRVIEGAVYADFEGVAAHEGDYCEAVQIAMITSPAHAPGQPPEPRFTLTEPALVRVSWHASSATDGAMGQGNASLALLDPDALGAKAILLSVEHSGSLADPPWEESGEITLDLDAGEYDLGAAVSHQGTINFPPFEGFDAHMSGHSFVRFRVEIVSAGCGGDVTGDGSVDVDDLNAVLGAWATDVASGDADCSGAVDVDDLNRVLAEWTGSCA